MNKLLIALALLLSVPAWAAQPAAPATQAEVNAGTATYKFVSPYTLQHATLTNAIVATATNAIGTPNGGGSNIFIRGLSLSNVTSGRVVALNASGNLTNTTTATPLFDNFFLMGISNVLAADGIALATNNGVLWITNTGTAGSYTGYTTGITNTTAAITNSVATYFGGTVDLHDMLTVRGNTLLIGRNADRVVLTDAATNLITSTVTRQTLDNFFAMGITNVLAADGIALATNNGVLWITNTGVAGSFTGFTTGITNNGGFMTTNGNITFGDTGETVFFTNNAVQYQNGLWTMNVSGQFANFENTASLSIQDGSILFLGQQTSLGANATSMRLGTNDYIASITEDGADNAEVNRYRFYNDNTGNATNLVQRWWEMSNYVAANGGNFSGYTTGITNTTAAITNSEATYFGGTVDLHGMTTVRGNTLLLTRSADKVLLTDAATNIITSTVTRQLLDNFFAMGISNILAADGIALATNNGVLWITNTTAAGTAAAGDSGAIQFNQGDVMAGTNVFTYDRTNNLARVTTTSASTIGFQVHDGVRSMNMTSQSLGTTGLVSFTLYADDITKGMIINALSADVTPATNNEANFGSLAFPWKTNFSRSIRATNVHILDRLAVEGSITNVIRTPTQTSSNILFDGSLGNYFVYTNAIPTGGWTNLVFTNLQIGQKVVADVNFTNATAKVKVNAIEVPANWYIGGTATAVGTNGWSRITVLCSATATNIQIDTIEYTLAAINGLTLSTNFPTGVISIVPNAVLTNLVQTVANNVTNENSTVLQINSGTLTLSPGVISNLNSSTIDIPGGANNIVSNVNNIKLATWTNYVQTVSNFVFTFNTNSYELKNQTNVVFTNIVEEATAVKADMTVHIHNTTGVTMGLVWPAYGAQHGYFFQTNANNAILAATSLASGQHGVASFTAYGTNIFATFTTWP